MDPQHRFFGTNSEVSVRIRVFRIRNTSIWIADPDPVLFDSWIRIQDKHHDKFSKNKETVWWGSRYG